MLIFIKCVEMLMELAKREKQAGIFPDAEIDAFMKVYTFRRNSFDISILASF